MPSRPARSTNARVMVPALLVALAGSGRAVAVPPLPFPAVLELSSLNGDNGFVINGIDVGDRSGVSVCTAGDVNGDGIGDVIIGAPYGDPGGRSNAGEVYIVFGGTVLGASGSIELSTLNGVNGFILNGIDAGDSAGWAVAAAGDVNGDGIDDVIIGAPNADPIVTLAGEAYIVFGREVAASGPFPSALNLSSLDGSNGFILNGASPVAKTGFAVASAGDVNGDGVDDVVVGARKGRNAVGSFSGAAHIVFGKNTVVNGPFPASIELSALNGTNGFSVLGTRNLNYCGNSVSGAGDVNGDGVDDVIVGAYYAGGSQTNHTFQGESYVVFGKNTAAEGAFPAAFAPADLNGSNGFVLVGSDSGDYSGAAVSAGDINGDGISDLLIGATYADPNGHDRAGECYVVYGGGGIGAGGSFSLASVDGSNGFVMNGGAKLDRTGRSIDAADVNGDGVVDVIVGAATAAVNGIDGAGKVYVVYGRVTTDAGPFSAEVELTGLNGVDGFALLGTDWTDAAGFSVSSAGDVNGDGLVDVIIGAKRGDPNGLTDAGESYIVFGRAPTPACAGDINSDGSTNAADFTILAGIFGSSVTPNTGGDLNGDGIVNAADFTILAADFGCGN